jgi:hypothetical protein
LRSLDNLSLSAEINIDESQSLKNDRMNIIIESDYKQEEENVGRAKEPRKMALGRQL